MKQKIYIIDGNDELINLLKEYFKDDVDYSFVNSTAENIDSVLKEIPPLIVIDEDNINCDIFNLCQKIKTDDNNMITPILIIGSRTDKEHTIGILSNSVQYYIEKPIIPEVLYYYIKNTIELLYSNRKISPLTGLPGNVQIQAEMKKRLLKDEPFAIIYVDLDNFKSYNDVYGFSSGDEMIKFTAKVLSENVHNIENSDNFVGHIGGDDFVAIISKTDYDKICQEIIIEFDCGVEKFYTKKDVQNGYVEIENRRGILEQFPLTTISVAIVEADSQTFNSTLEIAEVGAQVKHRAKTILGSAYVINRRKNNS